MAKNHFDRNIRLIGTISRHGHSLPNHQLQTVATTCGYDFTPHLYAHADAYASIAMKLL